MTRILLDECIPVKLKYRFEEYSETFEVSTVTAERWTGKKDKEILHSAERKFDVFVTIDQNLSYQQKLSAYEIAVIVMQVKSNRYGDILDLVELTSQKIQSVQPRKLYRISF